MVALPGQYAVLLNFGTEEAGGEAARSLRDFSEMAIASCYEH
jgi:hypothetical protein